MSDDTTDDNIVEEPGELLVDAARYGEWEEVNTLLQAGANVNFQTQTSGNTASFAFSLNVF
jgi:hypothetical protein